MLVGLIASSLVFKRVANQINVLFFLQASDFFCMYFDHESIVLNQLILDQRINQYLKAVIQVSCVGNIAVKFDRYISFYLLKIHAALIQILSKWFIISWFYLNLLCLYVAVYEIIDWWWYWHIIELDLFLFHFMSIFLKRN